MADKAAFRNRGHERRRGRVRWQRRGDVTNATTSAKLGSRAIGTRVRPSASWGASSPSASSARWPPVVESAMMPTRLVPRVRSALAQGRERRRNRLERRSSSYAGSSAILCPISASAIDNTLSCRSQKNRSRIVTVSPGCTGCVIGTVATTGTSLITRVSSALHL